MKIDDLPYIAEWRMNGELSRYYDELPIHTAFEIEQEMRNCLKAENRMDFIIQNVAGDPVGTIYLMNISWQNRSAELHVKLGENSRGLSYFGAEASFLMLLHAFRQLNMHKIYGKTIEYAERSKKLLDRVGFSKEAVYKKAIFQKGAYWDLHVYGLIDREFQRFLDSKKGLQYLRYSNNAH